MIVTLEKNDDGAGAVLFTCSRGYARDMVDVVLAWQLIRAMPPHAALLIVGDISNSGVARSNIMGFEKMGAKVLLAAADTFRAAAIEQIERRARPGIVADHRGVHRRLDLVHPRPRGLEQLARLRHQRLGLAERGLFDLTFVVHACQPQA